MTNREIYLAYWKRASQGSNVPRSTGISSVRLGACEVCKCEVVDVYTMAVKVDGVWDVMFGHDECLIKAQ